MSEEKRTRSRYEYSHQILCYKHIITGRNAKPNPDPIHINIQDISYNGIGIVCDRDLGMGDFLIFELDNGTDSKELMLEVRWCKYDDGDYIAGLQFASLTKESILFLEKVIKGFAKSSSSYLHSDYIM